MTAVKATRIAKDGASTPAQFPYGFLDESGAGTGPFDPTHALLDSTGALINPATKEGVAAVAAALAGLSTDAKLEAVRALLAGTLTVNLPSGAATEASLQALRTLLAGTLTVGLPAGAATDAKLQAILTALGTPAQAGGTVTANLGALNGASTAALQTGGNTILSAIQTAVTTPALATGASTVAAQTTGNTSLASIDTKTPALASGRVPVDGSGVTQPISATALPLPAGAMADATGQAILTALQAQRAESLWTDDTGVFFVRVDRNGTISWADLSGNAAAAPGTGARPAAGATTLLSRSSFQATAAATGYSIGDYLDHFVTTDPSSGAVLGSFWVNLSTSLKLATAPSAANISPISALPSGAATSALQTAMNTALTTLDTDLKAHLPLDTNGNLKQVLYDSTGAAVSYGGTTPVQGVAGGVAVPVDTVVRATAANRGGLSTVKAASATVSAGGSGYAVGDTITNAAGVFTVGTVTSGAVTAVTATTPAALTSTPSSPLAQTATSGGGTGATLSPAYAPASFQFAAANTSRRGFSIQNQSSGNLWFSGIGTATADQNSFVLLAGDYFESSPQHSGTGALSIIGTAAGQAFYAREF